MSGTSLAGLLVICGVVVAGLATWLVLVFWAGRHPFWKGSRPVCVPAMCGAARSSARDARSRRAGMPSRILTGNGQSRAMSPLPGTMPRTLIVRAPAQKGKG